MMVLTLATLSRISSDTMNSYSAELRGLPVMSDVMDATIAGLSTGDVTLPVRLCGTRRNALEKQAFSPQKSIIPWSDFIWKMLLTSNLRYSFRNQTLKDMTLEHLWLLWVTMWPCECKACLIHRTNRSTSIEQNTMYFIRCNDCICSCVI